MEQNPNAIEPVEYYERVLKNKFEEDAKAYFNKLVDESGINIEENQRIVEKYKEFLNLKGDIDKQLSKYKILRIIAIVAEVFLAFSIFGSISSGFDFGSILRIILLAGVIYPHFKILSPKIKELNEFIADYEGKLGELKNEAYDTMVDLNALFTSEMTTNLIKNLDTNINLDENFNIKRFAQLVDDYGFLESRDNNYSTINLLSGDIFGNPFVFIKNLVHEIVMETYRGSRTVSYEEAYIDSEGYRRVRTVTETLHASVQKEKPNYFDQIFLIYGNEAAPNLVFSREPKSKSMTSNFMNKFFQSDRKKLNKMARESVMTGGNFQAMTNDEFEMNFAAYDRDNEVEFRVLFSPLGQENMLKFLNNDVYGDDLYFFKDKMINSIYCTHTDHWDIDNDPSNYTHFDFVSCRNNFMNLNIKYFQDMFFTFAPLLSIPVYQQHKSQEYIYGDTYNYRYNRYTTEMVANKMNVHEFEHPQTETNTILKTEPFKSMGRTDLVQVNAYSYRTEQRYDYVDELAGDGCYYTVEVPWTEYIPITKTSTMEVTGVDFDENAFNRYRYNRDFDNKMKDVVYDYVYKNKLFAAITNRSEIEIGEKIKNIIKN